MSERRPLLSVIIVTWNTRDLLDDCLRSLPWNDRREMEVFVVDNASHDGTAGWVAREWPTVELIVNAQNEGFTKANNTAIRRSRGEFVLLINTDARLRPSCLTRMLAQLAADPRAGAVGPRLVYEDSSWQRWTAGRAPSLRAAINHHLFFERLPGHRLFEGLYLGRDVAEPFQPEWVSSACMLLRRSALDEVGLLDERYFVYMDDVDLCQRLRDAGWHVWYCPRAEAIHLANQSTKRQTGKVSPEALRAFNRYFRTRRGPAATAALRAIEAVGFAARSLAYLAAGTVSRGDRRLLDMARTHWMHVKLSLERPRDEGVNAKRTVR